MAGDHLSETFAALADPTRRAILARLATGEATVNELAEPFAVSVQAISKHLKVLERAGLVTRGRSAQQRPARLRGTPLGDAAAWLAGYRRFWESGFDRLAEQLREMQAHQAKAPEATVHETKKHETKKKGSSDD
jgi:DNA-binding transcriptional ArsR family regulator